MRSQKRIKSQARLAGTVSVSNRLLVILAGFFLQYTYECISKHRSHFYWQKSRLERVEVRYVVCRSTKCCAFLLLTAEKFKLAAADK